MPLTLIASRSSAVKSRLLILAAKFILEELQFVTLIASSNGMYCLVADICGTAFEVVGVDTCSLDIGEAETCDGVLGVRTVSDDGALGMEIEASDGSAFMVCSHGGMLGVGKGGRVLAACMLSKCDRTATSLLSITSTADSSLSSLFRTSPSLHPGVSLSSTVIEIV